MKAYCVSYMPLLYGPPGVDLSEVARSHPELLQQLLSAAVSGLAKGCVWFMHDDRAVPVLVYDRGAEIYDHLVEWSEYDPPGWFRLYFGDEEASGEEGYAYVVALVPRLDKSVARFMASFPPGTLDQASIEVVYSPLYVLSSGPTYKSLKGRIGEQSYLGILDAKDFDPQKREQFDPDKIRRLGPFTVHDLAELGGVTGFLEGTTKFPP